MRRWMVILVLLLISSIVLAQRPKLDLKVYAGYNTHIFVYKEFDKSTDVFHGWQGGFGFRVSYRAVFGEVNFNFIRNSATVAIPDSLDIGFDKFEFRYNAFQLPLKAGWIPIKTPAFKWYLSTGPAFRFNTRGKLRLGDDEISFQTQGSRSSLVQYRLDLRVSNRSVRLQFRSLVFHRRDKLDSREHQDKFTPDHV